MPRPALLQVVNIFNVINKYAAHTNSAHPAGAAVPCLHGNDRYTYHCMQMAHGRYHGTA